MGYSRYIQGKLSLSRSNSVSLPRLFDNPESFTGIRVWLLVYQLVMTPFTHVPERGISLGLDP